MARAVDLGPKARFHGVRVRGGPADYVELRSLARAADGRSRGSAPPLLASAALVRVAAGQVDQAIELLENARAASPTDPALRTDLAAAYLLRASGPSASPIDLARALEWSGESLALRPSNEARFDRAAALEGLGLRASAAAAWRDYLEQDGGSPWRATAEARLARLQSEGSRPSASDVRRGLREAAESQSPALDDLFAGAPELARALVEEELLGAWARAQRSQRGRDARGFLETARPLAAASAHRQADRLLLESVAAIEGATGSRLEMLAEAHEAFQQGIDLASKDAWPEAQVSFLRAHEQLERVGSPFAACALLQAGISAYYRLDYAAALTAFERARAHAPQRHRLVRALSLWLSGLVRFVQGRAVEALREHQEARALFAEAGEQANVAFLDSLLAADLEALGRREQAWESRWRALQGLDQASKPRRVFSILWEGARSLMDQEQPRAAREFLAELAAREELADEPVLRATTLVRRARISQRLGEWEQAADDCREVRELVGHIPPSMSRRVMADLQLAEGEGLSTRNPAAAVDSLTRGLTELRGAGNELHTATTLRQRARAFRALGQSERARADLDAIVSTFEENRVRIPEETQRIAYFELVREAADELIGVQWDAGLRWDAFATAERTRARSLLDRSAVPVVTDRRIIQARLPTGTALLEYAVLPDRIVGWLLTATAAQTFERRVSSEEARGLVERARRELQTGTSGEGDTLARLYEVLVPSAGLWLSGVDRLHIVPDKFLHGVPFAALRDGREGSYLVERVALATSPSASLLWRGLSAAEARPATATDTGRQRPADASPRALVVLDDRPAEDWPVLPGARDEATAVAALYPSGSRLLDGPAATPTSLLESLPRYEILHVASHAVVGRAPGQSGLLLHPDALGARLVTAEALAALPSPSRLRVAVLASCRSASGTSTLEGPLSLARALLAAGADSVIASLWDLPDADSAVLMPALHRRLASGADPTEGLRAVQIEAVRSNPSPGIGSGWAALTAVSHGARGNRPE